MKKLFASIMSALVVLCASMPDGFVALTASAATNELRINEVCSKNNAGNNNTVAHKNGDDYSDWIELYNTSDSRLDISGYGVSDRADEPYKLKLPENTFIEAKSFLIIYCCKDYSGGDDEINAPFGLSSDGETITVTDKNGATVHSLTFPALAADITYGSFPDGSDELRSMYPTPAKSNETTDRVLIDMPVFSAQTGMYANPFSLEITCPTEGTIIYYTTDGSNPVTSATRTVYSKPISIVNRCGQPNVLSAVKCDKLTADKNYDSEPSDNEVAKITIIRAAAYKNEDYSKTVTKSYFVGKQVSSYGNIPIISVSIDYDALFGYEKGIYCGGKVWDEFKAANPGVTESWLIEANYTQKGREWERECHFDLIESDGSFAYSADCGIRLAGAASRDDLQKSFRFFARADYGDNYFRYPFVPNAHDINGKVIDKYKTFVVRNGGNDTRYMKFTDNFIQNRVKDRAIETQSGRPCLVFIDGEYWGFYILQEDYTDNHLEQKYGVDKDNVVLIKNFRLEEGTTADYSSFYSMTNFIINNQMSIQGNYSKACSMLDMQSFADYMAVEMYICNKDWPNNNTALWRTRTAVDGNPYADGKWRMMLFDTEYSTYQYGAANTKFNYDKFADVIKMQKEQGTFAKMINSLCKNSDFKKKLVTAVADLANVNYNAATSTKELETLYNSNMPHLRAYNIRFSGGGIRLAQQRYVYLKTFLNSRATFAVQQVCAACNIRTAIHTVGITAGGGGSVYMNGRQVDLSLYTNKTLSATVPTYYGIELVAKPDIGYRFAGWSGGVTSSSAALTCKPSESGTVIKANFVKSTAGDVNNDGKINAKDLLKIRKYCAGIDNDCVVEFGDLNADGKLNGKDVLLIRKQIAEYNA